MANGVQRDHQHGASTSPTPTGTASPTSCDNGIILFNRLDADGRPHLRPGQRDVARAGGTDGGRRQRDPPGLRPPRAADRSSSSPLHDTLRRWIAPLRRDQIGITGAASLHPPTRRTGPPTGFASPSSTTAPSCGRRPSTRPTARRRRRPASMRSPSRRGTGSTSASTPGSTAGTTSWTGIRPSPTSAPPWRPTSICSTRGGTARRADFTMAGRRGIDVELPFNGKVRLTGNLHKTGVTTDKVDAPHPEERRPGHARDDAGLGPDRRHSGRISSSTWHRARGFSFASGSTRRSTSGRSSGCRPPTTSTRPMPTQTLIRA